MTKIRKPRPAAKVKKGLKTWDFTYKNRQLEIVTPKPENGFFAFPTQEDVEDLMAWLKEHYFDHPVAVEGTFNNDGMVKIKYAGGRRLQ
jgi:hypothetical protein